MKRRFLADNIMRVMISLLLIMFTLILSSLCSAAPVSQDASNMLSQANSDISFQFNMRTVIMMTLIGIAPACMMAMTAFTRIYIVLAILRQAIGIVSAPSNQIVIGVALSLTVFVMSPVFSKLNSKSIEPLLEEKISMVQAVKNAEVPFRKFMMSQTRDSDLKMFMKLAHEEENVQANQTPFKVVMAAFMTSELKTAFQIGFVVYIPFILVDLLVSSILMSMGMIMVSPLAISLPFKILLFTLANGWGLLFNSLISSFHF